MKTESKVPRVSFFESIRKWDAEGHEYWLGRDLARLLGYTGGKAFQPVIEKARKACITSSFPAEDHFLATRELQELSNGSHRRYADVRLSRFACYLCIMNADPSREAVALGQAYMAAHTYLVEVQKHIAFRKLQSEVEKRVFLRNELSRHNISLAGLAKSAGVISPTDFALFQNHGYKGLYGGLDARAVARRKGLGKGQALLDHMGSEELAANLYRVELAEEMLREAVVMGVTPASEAHFRAGKQVRSAIRHLRGINPEALPAAPTIAHAVKDAEDEKRKAKITAQKPYIRTTMKSIFTDQHHEPGEGDLEAALAETYPLWKLLRDFTIKAYPKARQEWKYPGIKFGWGFRICDNKRVIIYMLPRHGFFKVAFVFGQKATDELLASQIAEPIKGELRAAKAYKEGRGIRLDVKGPELLADIEQLILTKIAN